MSRGRRVVSLLESIAQKPAQPARAFCCASVAKVSFHPSVFPHWLYSHPQPLFVLLICSRAESF